MGEGKCGADPGCHSTSTGAAVQAASTTHTPNCNQEPQPPPAKPQPSPCSHPAPVCTRRPFLWSRLTARPHTHHTAQLPRPSHNIPAGAETKPGHTQPLCVGAQMVWEDPRRISDSPSNLPHLSSHHYLWVRRQGAWKLLEILLSMSNKHSVAHILIRP